MCGIVGILYSDPSRPACEQTVVAMRDRTIYRGPDDFGIYLDGPLGFGFRRLSIIDLNGGHQPMSDISGRYWIVFNGEIYNYRELKDQLSRRGHQFKTHSDTEVILALFAERGDKCVDELNGMFAFAIWDTTNRSLFLARDRMGVKPLYFVETTGAFGFSSEIKSLFASGLVAAEWRPETLSEYMLFRQVSGPQTMFRGVRSVPPGCTMTIRGGSAKQTKYWSPRMEVVGPPVSRGEALETLSTLLEDSVRLRLVSDVPVGTFCSGGVDSSLVTALAVKLKNDSVNTFSIGFDEPDFDESAQALQVSKHCSTIHHQLKVGNQEFSELYPEMAWHNDEPLDFANSIQIYALSRLAKHTVTVVLTGEGSDELFAGYPRYRIPALVRYARPFPAGLRELAARLLKDHRLNKLNRFASYGDDDVILFNASYNQPDDVRRLCPGTPSLVSSCRHELLAASRSLALDTVSRTALLDQETFLAGILNRQDKMSMAASIESRVPFMDYRIVEFANRLPGQLKLENGNGKALVKDMARTVLPAEIVDRRKSGFGVPLARWFRQSDGMGERVQALPASPKADMFDRTVLGKLVEQHRSGAADHSELLWTALNLVTWREAFGC